MNCLLEILVLDLYFLIKWLDEEELMDVLPARDIMPIDGSDVFELNPGDECKAAFKGHNYEAEVLAVGEFSNIYVIVYTCITVILRPYCTIMLYTA